MTLVSQGCPLGGTIVTNSFTTSSTVMLSQPHLLLFIHSSYIPEERSATELTHITLCPLRSLDPMVVNAPDDHPTVLAHADQP